MAQGEADAWKHLFGLLNAAMVKTAVDLEIPDVIEKHGAPISLSDLSSAVGVASEYLFRVMRFLIHHGIFKKTQDSSNDVVSSSVYYDQTPVSRLLTRDNMGPFMLLHVNPPTLWGLSAESLRSDEIPDFVTNGEDVWTTSESGFKAKNFRDAMSAHARVTASAIIQNYSSEGLEGIRSLVDVGGNHGVALAMLVKAFPWIRGICFDLPEIVAEASPYDGIEFVGGDMFQSVPKADAIMLMDYLTAWGCLLMEEGALSAHERRRVEVKAPGIIEHKWWILHDWGDEACIDILKKCKEAVPAKTGKVMIVDAIIAEDGEGDEFEGSRLSLDIMMLGHTVKGKERTYKEWLYLLSEAGFSRHTVKNIKAIESVIEAYP